MDWRHGKEICSAERLFPGLGRGTMQNKYETFCAKRVTMQSWCIYISAFKLGTIKLVLHKNLGGWQTLFWSDILNIICFSVATYLSIWQDPNARVLLQTDNVGGGRLRQTNGNYTTCWRNVSSLLWSTNGHTQRYPSVNTTPQNYHVCATYLQDSQWYFEGKMKSALKIENIKEWRISLWWLVSMQYIKWLSCNPWSFANWNLKFKKENQRPNLTWPVGLSWVISEHLESGGVGSSLVKLFSTKELGKMRNSSFSGKELQYLPH